MAFTLLLAEGGQRRCLAGRARPARRRPRGAATRRVPGASRAPARRRRRRPGRRRGGAHPGRAGERDPRRADGPRYRPRDRSRRSPNVIAGARIDPVERADGRVRAGAVRGGHPRRRPGLRGSRRLHGGRRRRLPGGRSHARASPTGSTICRPAAAPRWSSSRDGRCRASRSWRTRRHDPTTPDRRGELEDAQDAPGVDPGRAEARLPARQRGHGPGRGGDRAAVHRAAVGPDPDRVGQAAVRARGAERAPRGTGRVHRRDLAAACSRRSRSPT